ncbi:MAG: hypothetical protein ABSE48_03460 [Verrucomicrobiota bacterium]|jgi:formate dehydrogenase assembly factor FdhD
MADLKKQTSELLKTLSKIEEKQKALRAALARHAARLKTSQNEVHAVEPPVGRKLAKKRIK